jgi:hypothetical protein
MISSIHPFLDRTGPTLRSALAAALLACALLPATASAQAPRVPDSPAGRRYDAFMALLARSDTAPIHAFVDQQMSDQFRALSAEARLNAITSMRGQLRGARLVAMNAAAPTELTATVEAEGRRWLVWVGVDAAEPHRITGLDVSPENVPAPETLTAAQVAEVVDSVAVQLERNYVSADTGRLIAGHLRGRSAAGAYAAFTRPATLAEALETDLRAVNGDRHLYIDVNTGGGGGGGPNPQAQRRANYDFARVERLDGNVGYVKLTGISGAPEAREVAVDAFRFIQNTDAVILDLRGVPGGSGQMANFLISHFTAPDLPSLNVYRRQTGRTVTRSTLAEVPGPRRTDVPLYVLIDRGAASAAEDIPFVLRNLGRATLVGERTAGAGRNNGLFPAAHGMAVSISVSRVTDPASGREWEMVGVQPDIAVPAEQALTAAHQDALRKLAAAEADTVRRATLEAAAEYVGVQARPVAVAADRLAAYAGRYTEGRVVTAEGGRLYYQSGPDAPRRELVPLGENRFAIGPASRVEFAPGEGGRVQLRLTAPGDRPRAFDRLP